MTAQSPAELPPAQAPREASFHLRTLLLMVGGVTLPIVVIDQSSKRYVSLHMRLFDNITLIPHLLDITYTINPGAAFSIFARFPASFRHFFLPALALIAIIVILVLLAHSARVTLTSVALALILAGACGNLIDRALRGGQVIDFVRLHYYSYDWPIFNVADSAITIGVALIFLTSVLAPREHHGPAEPSPKM